MITGDPLPTTRAHVADPGMQLQLRAQQAAEAIDAYGARPLHFEFTVSEMLVPYCTQIGLYARVPALVQIGAGLEEAKLFVSQSMPAGLFRVTAFSRLGHCTLMGLLITAGMSETRVELVHALLATGMHPELALAEAGLA